MRILSELEKTKSELVTMIDPNKGTVNLSFLHSLAQKFIPTIISEFVKSEENRQINFVFNQGISEDMKEDFKENKIDIAFTSNIEEDGITSIPIIKQELFLITPLEHPLADREEIDLREVVQFPFVYYEEKSGLRPILDNLFKIDYHNANCPRFKIVIQIPKGPPLIFAINVTASNEK